MNAHRQRMAIGLAAAALFLLAPLYGPLGGRLLQWCSPFGLRVTYYRGANFEARAARTVERDVSVDYQGRAPARGVPAQGFSARWEGWLDVPATASYKFYSQSDDGVRVFVDDVPVIDNWRETTWLRSGSHGQKELTRGRHRLRIEHFHLKGRAALRVLWAGGPIPPNTCLAAPYLRRR